MSSVISHAEYPFQSRYLELPAGKLHYLDEGRGEVILFSHGTPEWSFAYRHLIKAFSKSYRCIAVDHLGFGISDKPAGADYRTKAHAERLALLIDHLRLKNINIVANDFGVSIALSYAISFPENVSRIAISNGWMWSLKNEPHYARPGKMMQGWLGKLLYKQFNFAIAVMMPQAYGDRSKFTGDIRRHYKFPFSNSRLRMAPFECAREIYNAGDWWESLWKQMNTINNKPFLILWGMKDKFVRVNELDKWRRSLKNFRLITLPDCGHFVHEEEPERMIKELLAFFLELS